MTRIVQKYGGTSVGSLERIEFVADKVAKAAKEYDELVVVVSAMSGETNRLTKMASDLSSSPEPSELDALLSTGEQVTMALLTLALIERGCQAVSLTGHQIKILTNSVFNRARIESIDDSHIKKELNKGKVVVVPGFQGVEANGRTTTLGRGGSDTTAVALAAALKADECQIYTDVSGVYTTDPRVEPAARKLDCITFEEMLEMASLGAKVLQIRAVEFAGRYKVPLRVLNTFEEGVGTLIATEDEKMESPLVSGLAFNRDEAKLTIRGVPDIPGVAYQILGPISDDNIDVDMIIQNVAEDGTTDFTFTVHRNDYDKAIKILTDAKNRLEAKEVIGDTKIVKISLVGVGMRSHAGIASVMFDLLGKEGINIQMISTSEIKISVVVDEKYLELAVRTLHSGFKLELKPGEILI